MRSSPRPSRHARSVVQAALPAPGHPRLVGGVVVQLFVAQLVAPLVAPLVALFIALFIALFGAHLAGCSLIEGEAVAGLADGDCGPQTKACPVPGTFDEQRCVSIVDPTTSCALVGNCAPCFFRNGTATCGPDGTCALQSCDFGFRNCTNDVGNDVCQTDTRSDPDHCGDCGRACPAVNGDAGCVNATCTITCAIGFGNCNQSDPSAGDVDGCETRLDTDEHCGVCSRACSDGTHCVDGNCTSG